MVDTPAITITGGGIAGQAMALAFAQAGIEVCLIGEQDDQAPGGVQLAPNAWAALEVLGVGDTARAQAQPLRMMRLMALNTGISLATLPLNDRPQRTPYCSMARADLGRLLAEAATATGRVRTIKNRSTAITSHEDGVAITLADGSLHETGWLIGCDGAAGICREYLEADAPGKRHHTRDAYRLIIPEHHRPRGGQATTVWLGEGGHIVHYPLADGRLNLVAMVRPGTNSAADARRMLTKQPLLADWAEAVAAVEPAPLYDYPLLGAWQRGRVLVAGDAAHPMPPHLAQGAGQGLVDAACMIRQLAAFDGADLQPVVTAWSAERMRMIRRVSRDARRAGVMFALDGLGGKIRNLGLASIGEIGLGLALERLWSA